MALYDAEGMPADIRQHALNIDLQTAGQRFYAQAHRAFTDYRAGHEAYREEVMRLIDSVNGDLRAAIGAMEDGAISQAQIQLVHMRSVYPALFSNNGDDVFTEVKEKHGIIVPKSAPSSSG